MRCDKNVYAKRIHLYRVREIVKELGDIGDLTSAYVRYRQHTDEKPYEPARFVSRRNMMFRRT